jgi:hypothetical protein
MAGDWIKIEHALPNKPEVMQLAAILGIDEMAVVGHLVCFWCWVDQNMSPDCPAVIGTRKGLDRVAQRDGFVDAMKSVGWLSFDEAGRVVIPNYEEHLSKSAKTRALEQRKKNRQRKRPANRPEDVPQPSGQSWGQPRDQRREEGISSSFSFQENKELDTPQEKKAPRQPSKANSAAQKAFDRFWNEYPIKAGKKPASEAFAKAFARIAKTIGDEAAEAKLVQSAIDYREYLAGHPSPPSTKYAQGWLNEERYDEDHVEMLAQAVSLCRTASKPPPETIPNWEDL